MNAFTVPEGAQGAPLSESVYVASLPQVRCNACGVLVPRRKPRMTLRASWRTETEYLCVKCWGAICDWATRFALQQIEMPLG